MKKINNFPCMCGHVEGKHEFRSGKILSSICWECKALVTFERSSVQAYHAFKADNLKYLETRYDETKG